MTEPQSRYGHDIRDAWYSIIDLGHQQEEVSCEDELAFLPFLSQANQAISSAAKSLRDSERDTHWELQ